MQKIQIQSGEHKRQLKIKNVNVTSLSTNATAEKFQKAIIEWQDVESLRIRSERNLDQSQYEDFIRSST